MSEHRETGVCLTENKSSFFCLADVKHPLGWRVFTIQTGKKKTKRAKNNFGCINEENCIFK